METEENMGRGVKGTGNNLLYLFIREHSKIPEELYTEEMKLAGMTGRGSVWLLPCFII